MVNYGKFLTIDRVTNIRNRNSNKAKFRKNSVHGCEICFLTYMELESGSQGVCNLCAAKAANNIPPGEKPINLKF